MPNHVKTRRKALGLTQDAIAQAIGTTKATIMKLERGQMQLTESWLRRLSAPLQCRPEELIATENVTVPIIGQVGVSGHAALYRPFPTPGASEAENYWTDMEQAERPPESGGRILYALRIGKELDSPMLPAGSLVYYGQLIGAPFDALVGKFVIGEAENGAFYLGRLQAGDSFGQYHLDSGTGVDAIPITPRRCAKIAYIKME